MTRRAVLNAVMALTVLTVPFASKAWDREHAGTFAVLPGGSGGPEGLEVDPQGNVYVSSFGFSADGPVNAEGRIFVFDRNGHLERTLAVTQAPGHLLGLRWRSSTGTLLTVDFAGGRVLDVNPVTGSSSVFMTFPVPAAESSPNDITFDHAGNVYVSDSFQGTIWRTDAAGGMATPWVEKNALLQTSGVPPFGANGLRFNHDETALFVANTGSDTIVKIPVAAGSPGTPAVFVNSINGADGLIVDDEDNLWVAANQADEIVVVNPKGQAIAKLGDFEGVRNGTPQGLLFPASLRFFGRHLLVTNLALDLRLFGLAPSVDSDWCLQVSRYTVSILPARLEAHGGGSGSRGENDHGADGDRHGGRD